MMINFRPNLKISGFTLAELLIALAILGVIATFTIPKVLQSQKSDKLNAMTKEAASTVASAFQSLKAKGNMDGSTSSVHLEPYLNYVRKDTTSTGAFNYVGGGTEDCHASDPCFVLHNGGYLQLWNVDFMGSTNLNGTLFTFDPDGPGPEEGLWFALYFNGRMTNYKNCLPGSTGEGGAWTCPNGSAEPTWFKW